MNIKEIQVIVYKSSDKGFLLLETRILDENGNKEFFTSCIDRHDNSFISIPDSEIWSYKTWMELGRGASYCGKIINNYNMNRVLTSSCSSKDENKIIIKSELMNEKQDEEIILLFSIDCNNGKVDTNNIEFNKDDTIFTGVSYDL